MRSFQILLTASLACLSMASGFAEISILEKDGRGYTMPSPPPPYAKLLHDNGFHLGFPESKMREVGKLTLEQMKQFNVVVIPTIMGWSTDMKPEELCKLLDAYMKSGGGVMVFQLSFLEGIPTWEAMNDWLKQYGASLRWEDVEDKEHEYKNPPSIPWQAPSFYWTDNIAPSPLTRDVKSIFYVPGGFRGPYMTGLNVDRNWQTLVSTMPTAKCHKLSTNKADFTYTRLKDEPTQGAAPLLAVRKVGKGRLALFGGSPAAYWFDLKKPVYAEVPQERGDGQRKSDWIPLLFNVLRWLGEPGQKLGKPGGYAGDVKFEVQPDWGNRTPIDWDKVEREGVSPELVQQTLTWHSGVTPDDWKDWDEGKYQPFKMLIGARSQLSGGKGTIADWKSAAQAAGYSAVVFREDILKLTEAQWKQFTDACAAASDANFRAIPGQEFEDWIGNRFMRFTGDLKYPPHLKERLTDGKVRDQLSWFFDVGWPVNFPISPKTNPTEYWNYRVYDAWPVYVFQGAQPTEDNRQPWEELVDNYEYPSPLALHLLDDPAQVAQAATQANTFVLAKTLPEFKGNTAGGLFGSHNNPRVYTTTGPVIDRFHALNMYRTTLGSRDVPGSYRYKVFIKAHSDKPIARVELWGGGEPLRIYRPNTTEFSHVVDEQHDRQRGLWLKVVDVDGGEARATGIMVHDKMHWFVWCGDHCNALPAGLGTDADGNVTYYGVGTRVKSSFQGIDGPACSGYDMWKYVPWGTDTSAPAVGTQGQVRLFTADGKQIPGEDEWYTSRVTMPYGTRDVMVERLTANRVVKWKDYVPTHQPTINGWYPYTKNADLLPIEVVHEDADLHRDAGEPAFQWNSGTITFKQDVALSKKGELNILLADFNTNVSTGIAYTNEGELQIGWNNIRLDKGRYLTWGGRMGNVTVYGLDDNMLRGQVWYDGKRFLPKIGYHCPFDLCKAGRRITYHLLIMRWPTGMPISERLDARVAEGLNLSGERPSYSLSLQRGRGGFGTRLFLNLETESGACEGSIRRAFLGRRLPVCVTGLNRRWTACWWRKGASNQLLTPIVPSPDYPSDPNMGTWAYPPNDPRNQYTPSYFSIDLEREAGDFFVGNVVTCDRAEVWLRVLQRTNGGFDVTAHNTTDRPVYTWINGTRGGPLEGWSQTMDLKPGEEKRVRAK